jgi:hypothetical protein
MSLSFPFRFAVTIFNEDGANVGTVPVVRDFEPTYEWARFYLQRRGLLGPDGNGCASTLVPIFDAKLGEPYCRGYRIEIAPPGSTPVAVHFPNTHLREYSAAVASRFVEQKKLREGEIFSYVVVAYPAPHEVPGIAGLKVTNASPNLPAQDAVLEDFLARAVPSGVIDDEDMPVFVSQRVLDEAATLTHAEEGTETGGILIGKLWRDDAATEIFVEVTAQIPAEYTSGSNVKLTFTPQTWAAADAAVRLRRQGEIYLGYWHSHPVREWCRTKACTLEAQRKCHLAKDFFSADDEAVMRAAFSSAYNIAIVANDTAFTDLTFSMFGNRRGSTQPRGFYVLEENTNGA